MVHIMYYILYVGEDIQNTDVLAVSLSLSLSPALALFLSLPFMMLNKKRCIISHVIAYVIDPFSTLRENVSR